MDMMKAESLNNYMGEMSAQMQLNAWQQQSMCIHDFTPFESRKLV